jgi:hypothetical protein
VTLYALVSADTDFAVDVFVRRADAEAALRAALADEPGFADTLEAARAAVQRALDALPWQAHGYPTYVPSS